MRYDVAFCPPCANGHSYETLRVSQLIRHPELSLHFTIGAGVRWFTPRCQVNASLATLVHAAGLKNLYLALPFDPWGNQIHHEPGYFDPALLTADKTPIHEQAAKQNPDDPPEEFICTECRKTVSYSFMVLRKNKICPDCLADELNRLNESKTPQNRTPIKQLDHDDPDGKHEYGA